MTITVVVTAKCKKLILCIVKTALIKNITWPSKSVNKHVFEAMTSKKHIESENAIRCSYSQLSCPKTLKKLLNS